MPRSKFEDAVRSILEKDSRYDRDAYFFLRDSLNETVKRIRPDELPEHRHVTGRELLDGLRDYALDELGCMALPVLEFWGVQSGRDVGCMVYNLIGEQAFRRSEDDDPSDFEGWHSFVEIFQEPFRPTRPVLALGSDRTIEVDPSLQPPNRGNKPATTSET